MSYFGWMQIVICMLRASCKALSMLWVHARGGAHAGLEAMLEHGMWARGPLIWTSRLETSCGIGMPFEIVIAPFSILDSMILSARMVAVVIEDRRVAPAGC